jgi:type II secretory pathway pseudopilin PulG
MTASRSRFPRRGITVLEVLISIGILAIGLTSVLAIVPAAKSQSARAVILDRASTLAANVLADAATFGLLRSGSDTLTLAPSPTTPVFIDPVGVGSVLGSATSGALKQTGIYGIGATAASAAFHQSFLQSRDDLLVTTATTSFDDPPLNAVIDGARAFEGRMTSLLCLSGTGSGPRRASVVVFHARDPNYLAITGTLVNSRLAVASLAPSIPDRTAGEVIRPGVVLWSATNQRLHQATSVSYDSTPNAESFFLTLSTGTLLATGTYQVQFLPDSVGLAERTFTPEPAGAFTQ